MRPGAARRRRRIRDEVVAAVGAPDRSPPDDPVGGEILEGQATAPLEHRLRDRGGQIPAVEALCALVCEPIERRCEIVHHEPLADTERPLGTVDAAAVGIVAKDPVQDLVQKRLARCQLDAVARQPRCGSDELGPGNRPVSSMRLRETGEHPGNGTGRRSDQEGLRGVCASEGHVDVLEGGERPALDSGPGNGGEEVEQEVGPVACPVDEHEPARAGPVSGDSATQPTNAAATQASTAFPARRERPRSGLGRERMPSRDRTLHAESVTPQPGVPLSRIKSLISCGADLRKLRPRERRRREVLRGVWCRARQRVG